MLYQLSYVGLAWASYRRSASRSVSYARLDHEAMSNRLHYSEEEFEALVSSALDELPAEFQRALEHVAVVVSDRGAENHAYGMYVGSKLGGSDAFGARSRQGALGLPSRVRPAWLRMYGRRTLCRGSVSRQIGRPMPFR